MKKVVLMLLLLICSLAVFSQTSQDEFIILEKLGITLQTLKNPDILKN